MVEVLRLNTRVTTTDPVWPEIRKYGLGGYTVRYDFIAPTQPTVTATVSANDADGPCNVTLTATAALDTTHFDALVAYLRAGLDAAGHTGPLQLRTDSPALDTALEGAVA